MSIAAGNFHTCAILDDDTLKCWGYNAVGQLGLGDAVNHGDGPNEMGDNLPAIDLGTSLVPIKVVGAENHTCVMFQGGSVKCWGYGTIGVLSKTGTIVPIGDEPGEMGTNLRPLDL